MTLIGAVAALVCMQCGRSTGVHAMEYAPHAAFIRVTCLFIRATWLIHMCKMTHSYAGHVAYMCAYWFVTLSSVVYTKGYV